MTAHLRAIVLIGGGSGAIDKVDGLTGGEAGGPLAAGDTIQCINSAGIYNYINIQDSTAESSPDVIRPDTNPGTNSWHLLSWIPPLPLSFVDANRAAVISIGNASWETFIFSTEVDDDLGEHNTTTGIVTIAKTGKYLINATISSEAISYASGEELAIGISIDSDTVTYVGERQRFSATFSDVVTRSITKSIRLTAGQTVKIVVYQTSGGAANIGGSINRNLFSVVGVM